MFARLDLRGNRSSLWVQVSAGEYPLIAGEDPLSLWTRVVIVHGWSFRTPEFGSSDSPPRSIERAIAVEHRTDRSNAEHRNVQLSHRNAPHLLRLLLSSW